MLIVPPFNGSFFIPLEQGLKHDVSLDRILLDVGFFLHSIRTRIKTNDIDSCERVTGCSFFIPLEQGLKQLFNIDLRQAYVSSFFIPLEQGLKLKGEELMTLAVIVLSSFH